MSMRIGYFAKPGDPTAMPGIIDVVSRDFATLAEAIDVARATADEMGAYSFIIYLPDGSSERQCRHGDGWKPKPRRT